ncbi:MAG: hypothetical protein AAGD05_14380, partial [Bacteroidota bacterium]
MMNNLFYSLCLLGFCTLFNHTTLAQCNGGMVATANGSTLVYACVDDGFSDFEGFITTSIAAANYQFVITDDQNEVLAFLEENFVDFNTAALGTCRVWGLSYTGNILLEVGEIFFQESQYFILIISNDELIIGR